MTDSIKTTFVSSVVRKVLLAKLNKLSVITHLKDRKLVLYNVTSG